MPAVRIDIPPGVSGPVWVAHVVRIAVASAATGETQPNTPSLRLEASDNSHAPAVAAQGLSTPAHGKHSTRSGEP